MVGASLQPPPPTNVPTGKIREFFLHEKKIIILHFLPAESREKKLTGGADYFKMAGQTPRCAASRIVTQAGGAEGAAAASFGKPPGKLGLVQKGSGRLVHL